jgi:hypothetical protein
VFIHGGDLTFGGAAQQEVAFLAANAGGRWAPAGTQDPSGQAVVVAINYRLGLLGFLSLPELGATAADGVGANFGFTDSIAALEWVQRNAAAFGGDASRVTVIGQSSGATSIYGLMAAPRAVGLFNAAVALSGSPNMTMDMATKHAQDAPIAAALGCTANASATAADVVRCLQTAPWQDVVSATPAAWGLPTLAELKATRPDAVGIGLIGICNVDGVVVTSSLAAAMRGGVAPCSSSATWCRVNSSNAAVKTTAGGKRSLLISHMGQEFNIAPSPLALLSGMKRTDPAWLSFLQEQLVGGWGAQAAAMAANVDATFGANATFALLEYTTITADYGVACPYRMLAASSVENISSNNSDNVVAPSPHVFLMANEWQPELPDNGGWQSFAYHAWDWWAATLQTRTFLGQPTYQFQPRDLDLSRALRSLWYQLASRSEPSPVPLGLDAGAAVDGFPAGQQLTWAPVDREDPWSLVPLLLGRNDRYPYLGSRADEIGADRGSARCRALKKWGLLEPGNWWSN